MISTNKLKSHSDWQYWLNNQLNLPLNQAEQIALTRSIDQLETGDYLPKVVQQLKDKLAPLAWDGNLSQHGLALYTEVCRRMPTTGASSWWNRFIRPRR
ncbi:hypothetical protein [Streptococcus sp. E24BD]|uniref:hypothetical protein n=1 Tax=Streptococcus sp. E24BD TaxID=3278715 RepID=UPI00359E7070